VSATTVAHHAASRTADPAGWHLCPTGPECPVAYFRGEDVVTVEELRAAPTHKGSAPDRVVCFCFGHTAREVADEVARTGRSAIQVAVREACRAGRTDCERENPRGGCCLGEMGKVVEAKER
jgi:hypothetical protein